MSFAENQFIPLYDQNWLDRLRIAGKCVTACLEWSYRSIKEKTVSNGADLEVGCAEIIKRFDCTPTFKGYKGFPGKICVSVNDQIVHGIPNSKPFIEGSLIKVDLGATFQTSIADAAITQVYGNCNNSEHLRLTRCCQDALEAGIKAIRVGARVGAIGNAIHHSTKSSRFALITNYGGHGVGDQPHMSPFVSNRSQANVGVRFQSGMALCIEPMLVMGDNNTRTAADKWTVVGSGMAAHFEKTVFVHEDHVEIITDYQL